MGVIEDTASQILSNTYGAPPDLLRARSSAWALPPGAGMSPGHVAIFRSINRSINLALANCAVPAIIWCFASLTGLTIVNKSAIQ
jgi:hypothetical protein